MLQTSACAAATRIAVTKKTMQHFIVCLIRISTAGCHVHVLVDMRLARAWPREYASPWHQSSSRFFHQCSVPTLLPILPVREPFQVEPGQRQELGSIRRLVPAAALVKA